jgi:hypothetical protein
MQVLIYPPVNTLGWCIAGLKADLDAFTPRNGTIIMAQSKSEVRFIDATTGLPLTRPVRRSEICGEKVDADDSANLDEELGISCGKEIFVREAPPPGELSDRLARISDFLPLPLNSEPV